MAYNVENVVEETIKKYNLFNKKENIVVALSGGKDSTTVFYILHKLGYNVQGLMIHLCMGEWSNTHKDNMESFCNEQNLPLTIIDFREEVGKGICYMKDVMKKKKNLSGSTVCGIMKRWLLNRWAKKLKADKIVTGHNLDDEVQNVLMNFLKGNIFLGANSAPVTGNKHVKGFIQRVKPLFFVPEDEIKKYTKKMGFKILYDQCSCSFGTYRAGTRDWMDVLSNKEKLHILENFQKIASLLRSQQKKELCFCSSCGEPASSTLCSACELCSHFA